MQDQVFYEGIYKQGFGMIAKAVMRDQELSIEAKAIYSYLCSFAGAGQTAFPSVELILAELNISRERFYKHRKLLIEKGYIKVTQMKNEKGQQQQNIYHILNEVTPQSDFKTTDNPQSEKPQSGFPQSDNPQSENKYSISNSLTNNSLKSNNINNNSAAAENSNNKLYSELSNANKQAAASIPIDLFQDCITNCLGNVCQLSPYQVQDLIAWEEDTNRPLVNFAIYHAGMRGARGYPLIQDILKEWSQANITELAAAVAYEQQKKNSAKRGARKNGTSERRDGRNSKKPRPSSIYG
ncbi:helix-turn-helix domain-containing protein [Listeria aquatica]|uniref:helix-turn-helix domain-containing protein n=1 Tax=Listeria aquatica TaxID=1494960 RepID=UPI003F71184D